MTSEVKFAHGGFYIYRMEEGVMKSGSLLCSIETVTKGTVPHQNVIRVGCNIQCGSPLSSYWYTTKVQKILEVDPDGHWCIFDTLNNKYCVGQMSFYPEQVLQEIEDRTKAGQKRAEERKKNPVDLFKEMEDEKKERK